GGGPARRVGGAPQGRGHGDGSVTLTIGTGTPATINYKSGDSLESIASSINDQVPGVNASVLATGTGYRLIVTGQDTGAANAIAFSQTGAGLGMSTVIPAQDASVTVNGTTVTRPSNVLTDVVPGVTLQLNAVTPTGGADTTINVARDPAGLQKKIQGLVDAYNAVAGAISNQLSYNGTPKGNDTLFGDSSLQGLQRSMSSII